MFTFAYSAELTQALGISYIKPDEVAQDPKLLR